MSKRRRVTEKIRTELETVVGNNKVTERVDHYAKLAASKQTAILIDDEIRNTTRTAYIGATTTGAHDMLAEMEVIIEGRAFDLNGRPDSSLDTLLGRVETKMTTSTGLLGLTYDVVPVQDETMETATENVDTFRQRFLVTYGYNHANP